MSTISGFILQPEHRGSCWHVDTWPNRKRFWLATIFIDTYHVARGGKLESKHLCQTFLSLSFDPHPTPPPRSEKPDTQASPVYAGRIREGERNPKKVGPCTDRKRWIEKTKFQWNMIFESHCTLNQFKDYWLLSDYKLLFAVAWGGFSHFHTVFEIHSFPFLSKWKKGLWKEQCRCANWCSYSVFQFSPHVLLTNRMSVSL